jgi:Tfp pilus assembly protein PilP
MSVLMRLGLGVALVGCCLLGGELRAFAQTAPPENEPAVQAPVPEATGSEADASAEEEGPGKVAREVLYARPTVEKSLLGADFTYPATNMLDPFVSFIVPVQKVTAVAPPAEEEEGELPPEAQRPLTPLQKMSLGEIERGLRAILWGDMGRKAVIEDSGGKGYIVSVGTPAGDNKGVITQIFNDRLVIQQEIWEGETKRMVPLNTIVKLRKKD